MTLAIPHRCGPCEIAHTKTLGEQTLGQRQSLVDSLRLKIEEVQSRGSGHEAEISTAQIVLGEAEAALQDQYHKNFKTEIALLGNIPDFFTGGKRIAAPPPQQRIHRGRTESTLRQEVHPEDVVLNSIPPDESSSSVFLAGTEDIPALYPEIQEDEADWTPREEDNEEGMDYDCWTSATGQEDCFVYIEPAWQIFRSRSFLSPVEEKAEPEWEQVLSTSKLEYEVGGREEVVTPEESSDTRQDSPLAVPVEKKNDGAPGDMRGNLICRRSGLEVSRDSTAPSQHGGGDDLEMHGTGENNAQEGQKKPRISRSRSPLPWIWRKAVTAAQ